MKLNAQVERQTINQGQEDFGRSHAYGLQTLDAVPSSMLQAKPTKVTSTENLNPQARPNKRSHASAQSASKLTGILRLKESIEIENQRNVQLKNAAYARMVDELGIGH